MKKKSYNPFKMWGSYVGAIIGLIGEFIYSKSIDVLTFSLKFNLLGDESSVVFIASWSIIGFLIGWGIHSLIRSLRK